MSHPNFELLLFDADGTLFDYHLAEKTALSYLYNRFEIEISLEQFIKLYKEENSLVWKEFEEGEISADKLKTKRFERLLQKINTNLNVKECSDFYLDILAKQHFLIEGAKDILQFLRNHLKIVLITNGLTSVQKQRITLANFDILFHGIVISEEIGYSKPGKEIFKFALDIVNHSNKDSALIVGDNLNSDILGGINFGIKTCWFNQNRQQLPEGIIPDYIINSLFELKKVVFSRD